MKEDVLTTTQLVVTEQREVPCGTTIGEMLRKFLARIASLGILRSKKNTILIQQSGSQMRRVQALNRDIL